MANLHHALLFTATLQERLLCIRDLAKSYRNEFRESQDVTARDSANCRCDCDNAVSSHEQPWWACCDRVERLQRFREITNSDRDDFRKVHNAITIEPVICARNRDTLPRITRAIAMYFREWDREAHKKRPRCAVFRKLRLRWIACEPRKWSHFWGIKFGDLGVGYTVWAAFRDAAAERQLLPWSSLRRLRWMGGTVGIATGSSDALSQQTQSTKTSN